jgi:uncharacterized membrane protein
LARTSATAEDADMVTLGARVYGFGIVMLALVCLAWGEFDFGQSVPKDFPARTALAHAAGVFMLVAGAAIQWRHTVTWGAAALTIYFGFIVVIVMDGRVVVAHYREYVIYSSVAAQLAVAVGALLICTGRFTRACQITFGVCAVLFGGAHFFYMNLTAPLVPQWLPFGGEFWGYATGIAHIAGGLALIINVKARLAAILLTIMYASFTPLVHLPLLLAKPADHYVWSENALNLLLAAVAWITAESTRPGSRFPTPSRY